MPLFDDEICEGAAEALAEAGFTRLLAVPAVPAGTPRGFRYPLRTKTSDGGEWFLRSWGTDFEIVSRSWLRRGMRASFSLGWAVMPEGQTDRLLLLEAFEPDAAAADERGRRVLEMLEPYVCRSAVAGSAQWGYAALRVAALLRSGAAAEVSR
ncbi:hypothetical protein [Actinomadura miaoliensis]|uniref:DUF317 domain-containing protein n=1 Tax=Actinomadura miaoliensis TaxID=430685 RepID=A0ABP7V6Q9_9ACTN